jgi:1-acyl-sn-glycerol-3-phosphate acyltransferase
MAKKPRSSSTSRAYVVADEERKPSLVAPESFGTASEEAKLVPPVEPPATNWLRRSWIMLITGGMFHVFVGYAALGCVISELVFDLRWYISLPLALVAYEVYANLAATEVKGAPDPLIRGQEALATLIDYLSMRCVIPPDVDLDPHADDTSTGPPPAYIIAQHPHGIHAFGCSALNFAGNDFAKIFPRIWNRLTGVVASVIFRVPVVREVMLAHGYRDASRHVCELALREGRSIMLVVGGEQESIRTRGGEDTVWLKNRKGFIRLAIREGVDIVPVYSFGLVDIYSYAYWFEGLRMWMVNNLRVCLPLFWGVAGTPIPFSRPVTTVVGHPVKMPHAKHPTPSMVEDAYNRYIDALQELFEAHKASAGYPPERTLTIIRDRELSEDELEHAEEVHAHEKKSKDD